MDRRAAQGDPADHGCTVTSVRTLGGIVVRLFEVAALRDDAKHVSVREVELPVITLAEPLCRLHDLVEHRLQPLGPGNRAHHRPNGALLLAKILRLTKSLAYVR
jgi:hypothetical protein